MSIYSAYSANDLKDAIMIDGDIKESMAYRRIREAKKAGVLIENNVGMLYYKEKEIPNEILPF